MAGGGGHEPGGAGDPLGGMVTGVDMSSNRPSGLPQHGDEAAGGFAGIASALRGPGYHSGASAGPLAGPAAELMQGGIIQQRCELGRMGHGQRLQLESLSRPAALKVNHPSTVAAGQQFTG